MAGIEKVLKDLESDWEDAEQREGTGYDEFTDGEYVMGISAIEVGLSKSSSRPQVAWVLEFADGEYEGKEHMKFDGIDNEVSMGYVKGTMSTLGIKVPKSIKKLQAAFDAWLEDNKGTLVNVVLKTTGEFQNIYINGLADEAESKGGSDDGDLDDMTLKQLKKLVKEEDIELEYEINEYDDEKELADEIKEIRAKANKKGKKKKAKKKSRFED